MIEIGHAVGGTGLHQLCGVGCLRQRQPERFAHNLRGGRRAEELAAAAGGAALVIQGDGRLSKPADFKGKKLGTPQLGNTQDVALRAWLKEQGVDCVIVDHHEPDLAGIPDCCALVNPKCGTEFTYLCAAGVVFKLGHALLKTRPVDLDLKELMDLVAVATISDIVPMIGENRLMVRHGLRHLPSTLNPGLRALQEVTGMNGVATSMDVGFRIGPRLNAAGRMDVPEDALATLTTDCRRLAHELAQKLDAYNKERQTHEGLIRREAVEMLTFSR